MHFYRVFVESNPTEALGWVANFAEAKKLARTFKHNTDLYVDLYDLPTSKEAIERYLNAGAPKGEELAKLKVLRSWWITPRGGLKEIPTLNEYTVESINVDGQ